MLCILWHTENFDLFFKVVFRYLNNENKVINNVNKSLLYDG